MDAWVTMRFLCQNLCDPSDISKDTSFEDIVRGLVDSEGIIGIADDPGEIVSIEVAKW